jgi:hypothetical protein
MTVTLAAEMIVAIQDPETIEQLIRNYIRETAFIYEDKLCFVTGYERNPNHPSEYVFNIIPAGRE